MPLCRYQIRNEFSLADREVYDAADKDDPEALLEGFAMAGLVGALRQLGDLAEFAAEIFSDLHDEVSATAARSHGLMVRVQHLEMEIPLIEKEFLKQTNHSSFFYRAGIDWHPNMHTDQNCITKGDMPRFIMDSYEETRAPPSFIFLDRFDGGGEGACLKRYTNPSFYYLEAQTLGTTNPDVQEEKKSGKGKRRGTQWRNGRTPKALPTSHSKLHQLLLEKNKEDNVGDPARRVKLKTRPNGIPFDLKTGESYMKEILKDNSPDHESLKGVSIGSVHIDFGTEVERHFIGFESPGMLLTNKNPSQKPELKNVISYHTNNSSSNLLEDVGEKNILVDRESTADSTMVGYQSDDVTSEVDIYIDPLASEPQIYSVPKLETKTNFHVSRNRKQVQGLDDTKSLQHAHFPDSQSTRNSTLSDDGISSLKKCISTSSYSDGVSKIARSIHLEPEVSNAYLINEIIESKSTPRQLKWRGAACNDVADNLALSSDSTEQTISNVIPAQSDKDSTLYDRGTLKVQKGGMNAQDLTGTEPCNATESEIKFATKQATTSVVDKHLYLHERLSCVPNISDASYSRRASKNQDMEELEEGDIYLDPDDGALITKEENLSTCQLLNGSADDDSKLAKHQPKLNPEDSSLKELDRNFRNEASATCSKNHNIMNRTLVHVPPEEEVNASKASSVISQIHSPITIMPPAGIPPLGVNLSDADVEREETNKQCETNTGVSKPGDDKLKLKSCIKQTENSNHLDQEGFHIMRPLSFLECLKKQQWRFNLLTQGSATMTDVGSLNVPLGSISPVLNKINQEEVPPPPPLPPVQGRMGRNQPISLAHADKALSNKTLPSLSQSMTNQNTPHHASLGKDLPLFQESTSINSVHEVHANEIHGDTLMPLDDVTAAGDTGQTHDLAVMNHQKGEQLRNPLIDSIVAHDKTKLRKVTDQAGAKVQISDERDSLLEQIRAKAFNLRPTKVQKPNIQGPTTNLRVAAILQKAKTIRHAFSGSDEDNDDSWSD